MDLTVLIGIFRDVTRMKSGPGEASNACALDSTLPVEVGRIECLETLKP
jgi:hypothetical protein